MSYIDYCKPNLGILLSVFRLDVAYTKAEYNSLWFVENGQNIKVSDFIGGYGSLFFGHNYPEIKAELFHALSSNIPFSAQGSKRHKTGILAQKLNSLLNDRFDKKYISVFSNSGAEAVEVFIKHSIHQYFQRLNAYRQKADAELNKLMKKTVFSSIASDSIDELTNVLGISPTNELKNIIHSIKNFNQKNYQRQPKFITLKKGFHGKTSGALQLTFNSEYKKNLEQIGPSTIHISIEDIDKLDLILENYKYNLYTLKLINQELKLVKYQFISISAIIVEPIQGEGGIYPLTRETATKINAFADWHNIPLAVDEIQCGIGRTGTFLYSEQLGINPDYVILSKSLGGGITKIGATCINRHLFGNSFDIIHSSTFAEDEHSAKVASKVIDLLIQDKTYMSNAYQVGRYIISRLKDIKQKYPEVIEDVRGTGLMIGLEFKRQGNSPSNCLRLLNDNDSLGYVICGYLLHEHRIRILPCLSNKLTIRLEPSVVVTTDECEHFFSAIEKVAEIIHKQNSYELCKYLVNLPPTPIDAEIKNFRDRSFDGQDTSSEQIPSRKVAFIGHLVEATDMIDWDESFSLFRDRELNLFIKKIYSIATPYISHRKIVKSVEGSEVQLCFIGFPATSAMIEEKLKRRDLKGLREKIDSAIEVAKKEGCSVVGFGGYTSIITNNCRSVCAKDVVLTTGNSLTVAMGIEALITEAGCRKIDISSSTFAGVGANGNICSVYCNIMSDLVAKVILVGREGRLKNLDDVAKSIFKKHVYCILETGIPKGIGKTIMLSQRIQKTISKSKHTKNSISESELESLYSLCKEEMGGIFPIDLSTKIDESIGKAQLIVSASNSADSVIFPYMISDRPTVICDIAVPQDTDKSFEKVENVSVIQGGIVRIPNDPSYKIPGISLPEGTAYACMSETLLLGLSNKFSYSSYGAISEKGVKDIFELSNIHGFTLERSKVSKSF